MQLVQRRAWLAVGWVAVMGLAGCAGVNNVQPEGAGAALAGKVRGGQQPVAGAAVMVYAAGVTGYGVGAVPLLTAPVFTRADGSFSITGGYTCPSSASELYVVATGGNPGLAAGTNNPALALMAAAGPCSLHSGSYTLDPASTIAVNEVTTVAAVYALRPFFGLTGALIGTSAANLLGLANSFALVKNLVDSAGGAALVTTPAGNGITPQAELNTLADALAPCVNSDGTGPACSALFTAATPSGGAAPADTLRAIYNIASNPVNQVPAVFGLVVPNAPFQPTLSVAPNDWSMSVRYTGGGLTNPVSLAVDADGAVWVANNAANSSVTELSAAGAVLSGATGFAAGSTQFLKSIALDPAGNVWLASSGKIVKLTHAGTVVSGVSGFTGGGLQDPRDVALDDAGNAWIADYGLGNVVELAPDGTPLSGTHGFHAGGGTSPFHLALDASRNVWVTEINDFVVTELSSTGTALSGPSGYSAGTLTHPSAIAIDAAGDAWVTTGANTIAKLSPGGTQLSPGQGYATCTPDSTGPIYRTCNAGSDAIAIDGSGNVWTSQLYQFYKPGTGMASSSVGLVELNSSGTLISGGSGLARGNLLSATALAVDGSGNVWAADFSNAVIQIIGVAMPVVTPLALAVKNRTVATRP